MVSFSVITLFPDWIHAYCNTSILGRAQNAGLIHVQTINPRDFTTDPHRKVDDAPYGGGAGMVLQYGPLIAAYEHLLPLPPKHQVVLTTPTGHRFDQRWAHQLAEQDHVVFVCGHYEGIDARVEARLENGVCLSVGDFVLTGGELAALCMIDASTRLLPGVLGKDVSSVEESFMDGLLEYPQYTRPPVVDGYAVPDILLSGNHGAIAQWRRQQALRLTQRYRPDLLETAPLTDVDQAFLRG